MRLHLISVASAVALLAGSAWAQGTNTQQPASQTPPANQAASPARSAGAEVSTEDMIGRDVYGNNDQDLGEVSDVILDPETKQIRKLVVGTGGFLGIGEKKVAIDIEQVQIRPDQGIYVSGLTQEAVRDMEEYDPDEATLSLDKRVPAAPAPTGGLGTPPTSTEPAPRQ